MIPGTSQILSKSGSGALLTITRMAKQIQENYGIILENIIYVNMGLKKIRKARNGIQQTIENTIEQIWYIGHTDSEFFEHFDVPD